MLGVRSDASADDIARAFRGGRQADCTRMQLTTRSRRNASRMWRTRTPCCRTGARVETTTSCAPDQPPECARLRPSSYLRSVHRTGRRTATKRASRGRSVRRGRRSWRAASAPFSASPRGGSLSPCTITTRASAPTTFPSPRNGSATATSRSRRAPVSSCKRKSPNSTARPSDARTDDEACATTPAIRTHVIVDANTLGRDITLAIVALKMFDRRADLRRARCAPVAETPRATSAR